MAAVYFVLNVLLWCVAFWGGLVLGKRQRRVWLPAAALATVMVAGLGLISTRADWEVHLMLWPDYVFVFHDREEIGPRMLARITKHTGLQPDDS